MNELDKHLKRLSEFLILPQYDEALFILDKEVQHEKTTRLVPKSKAKTKQQFESEFNSLLDAGYSWINFHYDGLADGKLVIII